MAQTADELRCWLRLIRCHGLGPAGLDKLFQALGSAEAIVGASRATWTATGVPAAAWEALQQVDAERVVLDIEWCAPEGRGLLTPDQASYPRALLELEGAAPPLFYRGDLELLAMPQIAVVGSRNATPQGIEIAENFAAELSQRGLIITSGLALGVDAAAHRGALAASGLTIAVCGTGLDRVYPARNRELAEGIDRSGLLISEFPPGTSPRPENFPRRNRLISGLSLGVLVVEAARNSGSLITARQAAEQGREVFAIPGSIHNPLARGCHTLIRSGAKLVESVDDILEEIGGKVGQWLKQAPSPNATAPAQAPHAQQALLDQMGDHPQTVDELVARTGLSVEVLSPILLSLELEGRIATVPGGAVMRVS